MILPCAERIVHPQIFCSISVLNKMYSSAAENGASFSFLHQKTAEIKYSVITWVLAFGGALLLTKGQLIHVNCLEIVLSTVHLWKRVHQGRATSDHTMACLHSDPV